MNGFHQEVQKFLDQSESYSGYAGGVCFITADKTCQNPSLAGDLHSMVDSQDFGTKQKRDIFKHYQALQTFFDVTGEISDRAGSSRAQKARAKLLKLTSPQFYELSTDVYDELQRRINETQNRPQYLPPKASFHIKRNQARQKLSNLPQLRFSELVDDILFEIRRRDFDHNPDADVQSLQHKKVLPKEKSAKGSPQLPTASIQTAKIVPQKASIDWSSEEEEEEEEKEEEKDKATNEQQDSMTLDTLPKPQIQNAKTPLSVNTSTFNSTNETPVHDIFSPINKYYAFQQPEKHEASALADSNTIEDESTEQNQDNTKNDNAIQGLGLNTEATQIEDTKKEDDLSDLNLKISQLATENEMLKKEINTLKNRDMSSSASNVNKVKEAYTLDDATILKYASEAGCIPKNDINTFNSVVANLYDTISKGPSKTGNDLFQAVSKVSQSVLQIISSVNDHEYKTEIMLTKGTLASLITSIRYLAIHSPLLPKITVYACISELVFSICRVVDKCGIKGYNLKPQTIEASRTLIDDDLTPVTPLTQTSAAFYSSMSSMSSQADLQNPSVTSQDYQDTVADMSPVKPLKITQKVNRSFVDSPSSTRKPSSTGLFSSVIDTKSPRASKLNVSTPVMSDESEDGDAEVSQLDLSKLVKVNRSMDAVSSSPKLESDHSTNKILPEEEEPLYNNEISSSTVENLSATNQPNSEKNEPDNSVEVIQMSDAVSINAAHESEDKVSEEAGHLSDANKVEEAKKERSNKNVSPAEEITEDLDSSDFQFSPLRAEAEKKPQEDKILDDKTEIPEQHTIELKINEPLKESSIEAKQIDEDDNNPGKEERGNKDASDEESFDIDNFDIGDPENTIADLLLYIENQTVDVISTIQSLLNSIKETEVTKGALRKQSNSIYTVISKMVDATSVSMNQNRNIKLKEHGSWIVNSLKDCETRLLTLCELNSENDGLLTEREDDIEYADKHFKQRLAGIAFDIAKCTKELVKTIEGAH